MGLLPWLVELAALPLGWWWLLPWFVELAALPLGRGQMLPRVVELAALPLVGWQWWWLVSHNSSEGCSQAKQAEAAWLAGWLVGLEDRSKLCMCSVGDEFWL